MSHLGMTGLKEATMVGWYTRTMELLRPLYDVLVAEVFRSHYVQTDESTVPVINNDRHQADKEYLWMSRAVMERLVVFFYSDGSRAGDVIKEVAHIGYDPRSGNYIKLRHGNFTVSYCHLIRKPNIPIGSKVFPGQPVAPVFRVGTPNYFNSIGSRLVRPVCIVLPAPHSCLEILFWSVWILAVCM